MTKKTYGILASVVGAAVGTWLWRKRAGQHMMDKAPDRGTVIYDNTPTATPLAERPGL